MSIRLPLEPLERWARINLRPITKCSEDQQERRGRISSADLGEAAGIGASALTAWRARHGIPLHSADRVACRLGVHPVDIWHNWYEISPLDH